ncbi:GTP-binding protein [Bacillus sp. SA1-12]|uniref:GTP-binding protein n=1 Tax=Bacillus sp. SA1-12 TaxID=1455638 RepID=UPI002F426A72
MFFDNTILCYLVREKGEKLFRYKGSLHIKGMGRRNVFQGIHMLFSGNPDRE